MPITATFKAARLRVVLSLLLGGSLLLAHAARADFDNLEALNQQEFVDFATSLGAATHYKALAPAEPLGTIGFDVGVEISSTDIDGDLFSRASDGSFDGDTLLVPRLHAHKGLPFGLDVGAFVSSVPDADLSILGAEVRYALINGNVVKPSIALRGSYSQVQGSPDVDLANAALELTVSKGFLMFTPYAGIGYVRTEATPRDGLALQDETLDLEKAYVGLVMNLGFAFTIEADRTGDITSYSAKAGIRF